MKKILFNLLKLSFFLNILYIQSQGTVSGVNTNEEEMLPHLSLLLAPQALKELPLEVVWMLLKDRLLVLI
jgi:hypothetical protein